MTNSPKSKLRKRAQTDRSNHEALEKSAISGTEEGRKYRESQNAERAKIAQPGTSAAGPFTAHMSKRRGQQRRSRGESKFFNFM